MLEMLDRIAAEPASGRDGASEPPAWAERSVGALEITLDSGHLEWASRMLDDRRTARVLALNIPELTVRIHAARERLSVDRVREAVQGVGSLIDQGHPLTRLAARARGNLLVGRDPS